MRRDLEEVLAKKILLLDGGMGTMIQSANLDDADYKGALFAGHSVELAGNNDLLTLTKPDLIESIHRAYLDAGADIIETNTFGANRIALDEYGLGDLAYELNEKAAGLARSAVKDLGGQRWVCGVLGPTTKTASMSSRVEDPGHRDVDFDELTAAYRESVDGLLDGGVDLLMIETVVDALNCKAAIAAIHDAFHQRDLRLPLLISATISDESGRLLCGQTVEAFWNSIRHARPLAVGLNCALGPEQLRPHLEELGRIADRPVSCHPNAGLPNAIGGYDIEPSRMAEHIGRWARDGLINIIGGCCGTTPEHVSAFAKAVEGVPPRRPPRISPACRLAGLEPLNIDSSSQFVNVGERTNVTGSARFKRLVFEERYEEAVEVARSQIENGAQIIDVNMDEAMLDGAAAMRTLLRLIAVEPDVARVPVMVDSSRWEIIEEGLKCLQGKAFINSISLKDGKDAFVDKARRAARLGAAVVVMACDESGQADTFERRREIFERSHDILTKEVGFDEEDIAFDPNVFAIGTGLAEHDQHAKEFIKTVEWLRSRYPSSLSCAGVSNVSFSFRGHGVVRKALNSIFLYHCVRAGLSLGIVNPAAHMGYEEIPASLRERAEDVVLARRSDATERLLEVADAAGTTDKADKEPGWRNAPPKERLEQAMISGRDSWIEEDVEAARRASDDPIDVIEGPLMKGMSTVGELFGDGKMFLPQLIKSARVMKKAVGCLASHIEAGAVEGRRSERGKVLLATVKGDVHDIGKSIVAVVLRCHGFDVVDLGVAVETDEIIEAASREKVNVVGLSGLIMPSLEHMVTVAKTLQEKGFDLPLLIGGATTSVAHTALKIAPVYDGPVIHVKNASLVSGIVSGLLNPSTRDDIVKDAQRSYESARRQHTQKRRGERLVSLEEARRNRASIDYIEEPPATPTSPGIHVLEVPLCKLRDAVSWNALLKTLGMSRNGDGRHGVLDDAKRTLDKLTTQRMLSARAVIGVLPANAVGDDIEVYADESRTKVGATFHFPRRQETTKGGPNLCLADFIAPADSGVADWLGIFAATSGKGLEDALRRLSEDDDYESIMMKAIADRLAEALADFVHDHIATDLWGMDDSACDAGTQRRPVKRGIRPAPGYSSCPDHTEKKKIWSLLDVESRVGISLTESCMMEPVSSVCGFFFGNSEAEYFTVDGISEEQIADYAARKGVNPREVERALGGCMQEPTPLQRS